MQSTDTMKKQLAAYLADNLKLLRSMRDEIRVEVHLAGMDAKDKWKKLEAQAEQAEKVAHDVSEASKTMLGTVVAELQTFKTFLAKEAKTVRDAGTRS